MSDPGALQLAIADAKWRTADAGRPDGGDLEHYAALGDLVDEEADA